MASDRRLHLGGKSRTAGWEVFDAIAAAHVDHVGDAGDLSRFPDDTFAVLYGSHILEHFDYNGPLAVALSEWHRVLRPTGLLCVSVPDMDVLCALFSERTRLGTNDRFQVMRMLFGGHTDAYDHHSVGLNREFLTIFLQQAGFDRLQVVDSFGLFADTSEMEMFGQRISLNMTAHKGATQP